MEGGLGVAAGAGSTRSRKVGIFGFVDGEKFVAVGALFAEQSQKGDMITVQCKRPMIAWNSNRVEEGRYAPPSSLKNPIISTSTPSLLV